MGKIIILYKSMPLERALDVLGQGTFYYSNCFDFNDENEINFDLDGHIDTNVCQSISELMRPILHSAECCDEWTNTKTQEIINLLKKTDNTSHLNALIDFMKLTPTFCTSLIYDKKMWKKDYTNYGRGVCFVLEHRCYNNSIISINGFQHFMQCAKVNYVERKITAIEILNNLFKFIKNGDISSLKNSIPFISLMFTKNKYDISDSSICWEEEKEYRIQIMPRLPYLSRSIRIPITSNSEYWIGENAQSYSADHYSPLHKIIDIQFGPELTKEDENNILDIASKKLTNFDFIYKKIKKRLKYK